MARESHYSQTGGAPIPVRICQRMVAVLVDNAPSSDLLSAFPTLAGGGFAIASYAESPFAAHLARTLERVSGSIDMSFRAAYRDVKRRTRTATVRGDLTIANGRREPPFFGGHARLLHDFSRWENGEVAQPPVQLWRLLELEDAGVDVIEFPSSPAVDLRFAGIHLAQPVVLSLRRLSRAQALGRLEIEWSH